VKSFEKIEKLIEGSDRKLFRKVVHMMGFFLIAGIIEFLPRWALVPSLIMGILTYIIIEILRVRGVKMPVIAIMVEHLSRKSEKGWIFMPTFYFLLSLTMIAMFFDTTTMYLALIALTFGDSTAALVGERYGRHELFGDKTMEGSLAFFIVSFIGFTFFIDVRTALVTAAFASIIESISYEYDNFTVPISVLVRLFV